jgi:hypothetical protein
MPKNRPNVNKIYQHHQLLDSPIFAQIGIFGLKKYHLATLVLISFISFISFIAATRIGCLAFVVAFLSQGSIHSVKHFFFFFFYFSFCLPFFRPVTALIAASHE